MIEPQLDPGIRQTVAWLQANGFQTTDSGDGVSKLGTDQEACMQLIPNVAMEVRPPEDLIPQAKRLHDLCVQAGLDPQETVEVEGQEMPAWQVEALYLPASDTSVLLLTGVDDQRLTRGQHG